MFDLLSKTEDFEAANSGWVLTYVFDLSKTRWRAMVLPSDFSMGDAEKTGALVVAAARMGQPLAQKALRLVMKSNQENNETQTSTR